MRARPLLALALAGAITAAPRAARAEYDPMGGALRAMAEAIARMWFWGQLRLGASSSVADWAHPGGVGVRGSATVNGTGLGAALRYERVGTKSGGVLTIGPEFRPLELARSRAYFVVDPFFCVGGEIGGGQDGFRAAMYAGGGVDVALIPTRVMQPAVTIEYAVRPLRTPDTLPLQLLHVGGAFRMIF